MSTRCTIHFGKTISGTWEDMAIIYRHCEGVLGVLADLNRFFTAVKELTSDTRFNDPSYLAARFVGWQAEYNRQEIARQLNLSPCNPFDFLDIGIVITDPGDIEYRYYVDCSNVDDTMFPAITWDKVR